MNARGAPRVAVLGAGIMGSSTALFLARAGCEVVLIDQAASPMEGASRWNEGKVHLGFLYAADQSTKSARRMIPGGLAFKALIEELIGTSLAPAIAPEDDFYLVHPNSVVDADSLERYFLQVCDLMDGTEGNGGYVAPIGPVQRLSTRAVQALSSGAINAGFCVPERSVCTNWVADRFVEALAAEPRITLQMRTKVAAVDSAAGSWDGPWTIRSNSAVDGRFDAIVNASWEGRLAVDLRSGLALEPGWSHRFRLSLFVGTMRPLHLPNVVLAIGPFGDVKSYSSHDFYLSWYPSGLLAEGTDVEPPEIPAQPSPPAFIRAVKEGLSALLPGVNEIFDNADKISIGGGWVFARGKGSLADPLASLHRRDQFGIKRVGTYISVDTGKYSTAPWLARQVAAELIEGAHVMLKTNYS